MVPSRIASKHPHISHDLHEVRHRALFSLALKYGEESHVQEAMDVFLRARSDVTANYYEHTEECLEWLHHAGVKIAVLTNGSADLSMCPVLSKYLSFSFTAAEVGISKPAPVGFVACAQVSFCCCFCLIVSHHFFILLIKNSTSLSLLHFCVTMLIDKNNKKKINKLVYM